jgi:hypothetical protein
LHGTYILEGPAQVKVFTSENWVHIWSNVNLYTRWFSWKPNYSTQEPDWLQYNSPTTCIIAQQYSSTRILEMLFLFLYFFTFVAYESAWLEIV